METLTAKIARQSNVILVLAKITRILLYIVLGVSVFLLISTWTASDQPLLRIGNTSVYATIPLQNLLGVNFDADTAEKLSTLRFTLARQLAAFVLAQVMIARIIRLFTLIRDSKDPFSADVARPMKAIAILLGIIISVQNTILGVVVALTIFAFALIFQYGAQLQNQVDETL